MAKRVKQVRMRAWAFAWLGAGVASLGCAESSPPAKQALPPPGLAGASGAPASSAGTGVGVGGEARRAQPAAEGERGARNVAGPSDEAMADLPFDTPILTINQVALTRADLERAMVHQAAMLGVPPGELPPDVRALLEAPAYEGLLKRELLRQEAMRRGLSATPGDVRAEKQKLLERLPAGRTLTDVLSRMRTDEATFERDLAADLSIGRLMTEIQRDTPRIDEQAARKLYDANPERYAANDRASVRHILVALRPGAAAKEISEARQQAEQLRAQVNGKDVDVFADVARRHSDDEKTRALGGDLGALERREMLPQFAEVAFQLRAGEVSDVVRTDRGFHILRGAGVERGPPQPFDEVKAKIIAIESTTAKLQFEESLIERLQREAAVVRHHSPRVASAQPVLRGPTHGEVDVQSAHQLPLPSKENVLPGMQNPHGSTEQPLRLDEKGMAGATAAPKLELAPGQWRPGATR